MTNLCDECTHANVCAFRNDVYKSIEPFGIDDGRKPIIVVEITKCSFFECSFEGD
jgi:hypothetical protein